MQVQLIKIAQIIFAVLLEHKDLIFNIITVSSTLICMGLHIFIHYYSKKDIENNTNDIDNI